MRLRVAATTAFACVAGVVGGLSTGACDAPTQVRLEISTDLSCSASRGVAIIVGESGSVETAAPRVTTRACDNGVVGSLVLLPSAIEKRVSVLVAQGVNREVESCTARDGWAGCIVARRELYFAEHAQRIVPIRLQATCAGTACSDHATCATAGVCVDAFVDTCDGDGRCVPRGLGTLGGDAAVTDATPTLDGYVFDGGGATAFRRIAIGTGTSSLQTPAYFPSGGHTCVVDRDGILRCWGRNDKGELGQNNTIDYGSMLSQSVPPIALGDASADAATVVPIVDVSGGELFTCAVLADQRVKCFGAAVKNTSAFAELGTGDLQDYGGGPNDMARLPFVSLGTGVRARAVAAGETFACALVDRDLPDGGTEMGRVKCWGNNNNGGQLGLGSTATQLGKVPGELGDALPFLDLRDADGSQLRIAQIAAGAFHACALTTDGRVKCWGNNLNGQLGLGDLISRGRAPGDVGVALPFVDLGPGITARKLALGIVHSCAALTDGTVKCWGRGSYGALGYDTTSVIGGHMNEMGSNLAPVLTGGVVTDVCVGLAHTCVVLEERRIKCWGWNDEGACGTGDTVQRGDSMQRSVTTVPEVKLGTQPGDTPVRVACGGTHTCAELANGRVKCWGLNKNGGLGLGDTMSRGKTSGEMGDSLPYVRVLP